MFVIIRKIRFYCTAEEFKEIAKWGVKNLNSIKSYIRDGLRVVSKTKPFGPHYVSFLVPRKHSTNEKSDKMHLNLHMCAYTIRSHEGSKDGKRNIFTYFHLNDLDIFTAIYYDPSPECYKHEVPEVLDLLKKPAMQTFTYKFGVASGTSFCTSREITDG